LISTINIIQDRLGLFTRSGQLRMDLCQKKELQQSSSSFGNVFTGGLQASLAFSLL